MPCSQCSRGIISLSCTGESGTEWGTWAVSISYFGSSRQMKMAVISSFKEVTSEEALDLDGVTSSASLFSYGFVSSWPSAAPPRQPSSRGRLGKVPDILGWILVLLGLLPGGTEGPKRSFTSVIKICLALLVVGLLGFAFIIIQCKGTRYSDCNYLRYSFLRL